VDLSPSAREKTRFWREREQEVTQDVDTVIRKIEEQRQHTGYGVFCARHRIDCLAPELADKSMRLFAKHVIPAFA
jgi:hypothetical protein